MRWMHYLFGFLEDVPLTRKFAVVFFLSSALPCFVLMFVLQNRDPDSMIDEYVLFGMLSAMAVCTIVGFHALRRSVVGLNQVTQEATRRLSKELPSLLTDSHRNENEVTRLAKTFSEVTNLLEDNIQRLESSKRAMQYMLTRLAAGISSPQSVDAFLDLIVEITTTSLDAKSGALFLLDPAAGDLYVKASSGLAASELQRRYRIGQDTPGLVAQTRSSLLVSGPNRAHAAPAGGLTPPLYCAPMIYQERLVGVLAVGGKSGGRSFDEDEQLIVTNLALQTAVAVEHDRLKLDAERTYLETISALAMAVEARDPYSRGHSDRVAQYAARIAAKMGLTEEQVQDIRMAARLHDVGKIGIPDNILKKPGSLTDEEWEAMRRHPVIGEGIVKPVRSLANLCHIIRSHHERLDGQGYPDKLTGAQIPLEAKILAVADSFDAIVSDRPYRKGEQAGVAI